MATAQDQEDQRLKAFGSLLNKTVGQAAKHCACCLKKGDVVKLMMCSSCKKIQYCSTDCQKQDWKRHKPLCKLNVFTTTKLQTNPGGARPGVFSTPLSGQALWDATERWHTQNRGILEFFGIQASGILPFKNKDSFNMPPFVPFIKLDVKADGTAIVEKVDVVTYEEAMALGPNIKNGMQSMCRQAKTQGRLGISLLMICSGGPTQSLAFQLTNEPEVVYNMEPKEWVDWLNKSMST